MFVNISTVFCAKRPKQTETLFCSVRPSRLIGLAKDLRALLELCKDSSHVKFLCLPNGLKIVLLVFVFRSFSMNFNSLQAGGSLFLQSFMIIYVKSKDFLKFIY